MTPEQIKRLRKQLQLTQRALAESLGITVTTVHRWEAGLYAPRPEFAEKIRQLEKQAKGAA